MYMKENLELIKKELELRGIKAELIEVCKNGVNRIGFCLVTGKECSPVVYYSPGEKLDDFIARIEDILRADPEIDVAQLFDRESVRTELFVTVQKASAEQIVKKKLLNIEAVLCVKVCTNGGMIGRVKVTERLLSMIGLSVDDAWDDASRNMASKFCVRSINEILGVDDFGAPPFYVVMATDPGYDGAAALCFPDVFGEFCRERRLTAVLILPSSTQEVLIVPEGESPDYLALVDMVRSVNTIVDPEIQLKPAVYRYDFFDNGIDIVAGTAGSMEESFF